MKKWSLLRLVIMVAMKGCLLSTRRSCSSYTCMGQGEAEIMLAFAWLCIRVFSPTVPDCVVQRRKRAVLSV